MRRGAGVAGCGAGAAGATVIAPAQAGVEAALRELHSRRRAEHRDRRRRGASLGGLGREARRLRPTLCRARPRLATTAFRSTTARFRRSRCLIDASRRSARMSSSRDMFTGLIEAVGHVDQVAQYRQWTSDRRSNRAGRADLADGESVSVNGVCLTVAQREAGAFAADIGPETARVTTLGGPAARSAGQPRTGDARRRPVRWPFRAGARRRARDRRARCAPKATRTG